MKSLARSGKNGAWFLPKTKGLVTMRHNGNERDIDTAEYWHIRSQETRARAEKMITPETRLLMLGLADDYERTAHIVEGMASIQAAGRLVARIERVATRIAASPHIGGTTRKSGFLRFPVGKYLIVYEIESDEVVVLYVRHSARPRPWEGE